MNRRLLIEGYQPIRSGGTHQIIRRDVSPGPAPPGHGKETAAPSGPTPAEKLPKTHSSVHIPRK